MNMVHRLLWVSIGCGVISVGFWGNCLANQEEVHHVMDALIADETSCANGDVSQMMQKEYIPMCGPLQIEEPPRWMVFVATVFSRCYGWCIRFKHSAQRTYRQGALMITRLLCKKSRQKHAKAKVEGADHQRVLGQYA